MKFIYLLLLLSSVVFAEVESNVSSKDWILDRTNFYFEDDIFTQTDDGYSAGTRLSFLWYVPDEDYLLYDALFLDLGNTYSYFTFAVTNQIFTPTNTATTDFIEDDRPYAGWTYGEFGIHKSSKRNLRSLVLKIGVIGSSSYSKEIQNGFHALIGNDSVNGWGHQLNNELGVNLKYSHKWLLLSEIESGFGGSLAPFIQGELGNVAINAAAGANGRIGYNIPKDYGVSSIDYGADPGIPIYNEYVNMRKKPWSFSVNFTAAASAVGRDIFVDGNTLGGSHSVEKEPFVYYYGFGFTLRYKNFVFDFIEINNSKRFKIEEQGHGVGTLVFSYLF